MPTLIEKTKAAEEAWMAVVRLYSAAERRHKEQIQDTIDALKAHGGNAIVNEYRYVFRNETEMEGYGGAVAAINRNTKNGMSLEGIHAAIADEIEDIKRELLICVGADRSTCPVKEAQRSVRSQAMLTVLDNLTRIKLELEAEAAD